MKPVPLEEADIVAHGVPQQFDYAVEYHAMRHHADCEAPVTPTYGRTWDQLGDDLAARFPPHVWHPSHWDAYEAAYPPAPLEAPPRSVGGEALKPPKPRRRGRRTPTVQQQRLL